MMKSVFTLEHSYEKTNGEDETKFIGVYSTEEEAKKAVDRLKDRPGFCDRPDHFIIDEYELDKDNWAEGFASVLNIQVKNKQNDWMTVQAKCFPNDTYQIIELHENHLLGDFKHLDIVECEEREDGCLYAIRLINSNS
jgi:hypothetical protein